MKKRKFAAGGYLPNYGDEQPQNPFGPSVINPTGQDMGLPSMGNPYDPYEQGYRHGGKVKMTKKMAEGGELRGRALRAAEDPEFARRLANEAAYSGVQSGRGQFAIGSPERQNYEAYRKMEEAKYRSAMGGRGAPVGTYTASAFNPATSYTAPLAQQRTVADLAKKAADAARTGRGMAKGGMASSASKRADGCAVKGKTKGKMR
jgi:hypothetical protein